MQRLAKICFPVLAMIEKSGEKANDKITPTHHSNEKSQNDEEADGNGD